jgi:hypothetical protein
MNKFPLKRMGEANTGSRKNVFIFNESDDFFKMIKEFKEHYQ